MRGTNFTLGAGSQDWVLDMLGNWVQTRRDLDGAGYESTETEDRE